MCDRARESLAQEGAEHFDDCVRIKIGSPRTNIQIFSIYIYSYGKIPFGGKQKMACGKRGPKKKVKKVPKKKAKPKAKKKATKKKK